MSFIPNANRGTGAGGSRRRGLDLQVRRARIRTGAGTAIAAVFATALATAAALALATRPSWPWPRPLPARAASAARPGPSSAPPLSRPWPWPPRQSARSASGWGGHGRLNYHARVSGLTPGSVARGGPPGSRLFPGHPVQHAHRQQRLVRPAGTLHSHFTGPLRRGSRLLVRMGVRGEPPGPDADRRDQMAPVIPAAEHHRAHRGRKSASGGVSYGTPRGRATVAYNASRQTLTVTVHASGVTPGPHAAHIHLGSCMLPGSSHIHAWGTWSLPAGGRIAHAVRVFTHVTAPIPAHGWHPPHRPGK